MTGDTDDDDIQESDAPSLLISITNRLGTRDKIELTPEEVKDMAVEFLQIAVELTAGGAAVETFFTDRALHNMAKILACRLNQKADDERDQHLRETFDRWAAEMDQPSKERLSDGGILDDTPPDKPDTSVDLSQIVKGRIIP